MKHKRTFKNEVVKKIISTVSQKFLVPYRAVGAENLDTVHRAVGIDIENFSDPTWTGLVQIIVGNRRIVDILYI
jgi:hypothetical protein